VAFAIARNRGVPAAFSLMSWALPKDIHSARRRPSKLHDCRRFPLLVGSDLRHSVEMACFVGSRGDNTRWCRLPEGYFHRTPPIGNKKAAEADPGGLLLAFGGPTFP